MSNDNKYEKLAKNSIVFAIANFGSSVLRFIIVPFYTYYLSTSEYGIVDTLNTTVSLLMPVMLLAIHEATLRFSLNKEYNSASVLKNSFLFLVIGGLFFLLSVFPFYRIKVFDGLWCEFYLLLLSYALHNIMMNYTRGVGKSIAFMLGGIINTAILLISNVIMIAIFKLGISGYLVSLILGYFVSALFLMIYNNVVELVHRGKIDSKLIKKMLKYSIPLIPTAAMWWLMNVADRYAITYFLGVSFTGIYAVSHKIPSVISMFYSIFQQAWQISAVEEVNSSDRNKFYEGVYDTFFRGLFMVSSLIILFIKPILTFVISSSYEDAWRYAPILVIGAVFSSMAGFLGVNYVASEKTIGALTTSAFGAIINIILNLFFVPLWGVQGAAVTTLIGFYAVWFMRATVSNGGLRIKQNYVIIHFLFALNLVQSIVLIIDYKYQLIIQICSVLLILYMNKKLIIKFYTIGKHFLAMLRSKI